MLLEWIACNRPGNPRGARDYHMVDEQQGDPDDIPSDSKLAKLAETLRIICTSTGLAPAFGVHSDNGFDLEMLRCAAFG